MKIFSHKFYLALGLYGLVLLFVFPRWTVDDAYITFRYARNLADHGALTWNVGEPPVEGYTGIVLPVVFAAAIKIGLAPVPVAHGLGVGGFVAGGIVLFLLLRRLIGSATVRKIILLLYFSSPFMYTHAFSGLETTLFGAAILTSLYISLAAIDRPAVRPVIPALLLLTSLIRPEGVVLAVLLIAALGVVIPDRRRFGLHVMLWFVLPGLLYVIWKIHYYGGLLPNTYYAKAYDEGLLNPAALSALGDFAEKNLLFPLLLAVALVLIDPVGAWGNFKQRLLGKDRFETRPYARLIVPGAAGLFVIVVLAQYMRSAMIMNFSHRFFMPLFPLLLIFVGMLMDLGAANVARTRTRGRRVAVGVVVLMIVILPVLDYPLKLTGQVRFTRDMKALLAHEHIPAGQFVAAHVPASEWLAVIDDAGAIPYYAGLKTIDFGRLSDRFLARHDLTDQAAADYFFSADPGVVVITSTEWDRLQRPRANAIIHDPRFARYHLVKKYRTPGYEGYYEFVYLRDDLFERFRL